MSEATEVPMICYDCGGTLTDDDAIWSWSPSFASHINYSQCIASLNERITAATQRVESAEAENERLRKAWQSADTTAQALSMNAGYIDVDGLRVGVHMVRSWLERMKVIDTENDLLQAERDALRKDAARLDWLESQKVFRASFYQLCFPPCWVLEASELTNGGTLRVAIDAAMVVQP